MLNQFSEVIQMQVKFNRMFNSIQYKQMHIVNVNLVTLVNLTSLLNTIKIKFFRKLYFKIFALVFPALNFFLLFCFFFLFIFSSKEKHYVFVVLLVL